MLDNRLMSVRGFYDDTSKIKKWYDSKNKILTVITNPYNSVSVCLDLISNLLKEDKKILYIWGMRESNKEVVNAIKRKNYKFKYSYLENEKEDTGLVFANFNDIDKLKKPYDLCVIDDISIYSTIYKDEIRDCIESIYLNSKRIIIFSIERIIKMGSTMHFTDFRRTIPFVEPRVINTRVKLEEDIPYILYDYLMWFKDNNRKVIMFAPSESKVNKIYDYCINDLSIKDAKIIKFLKEDSIKKIEPIYNMKDKSVFIITNNLKSYVKDKNDIDVVALFSDDIFYDYKKIIYFCAEVGKNINSKKVGEVLLVSKDISKDMDIAKERIRDYNKQLWEKGLLGY